MSTAQLRLAWMLAHVLTGTALTLAAVHALLHGAPPGSAPAVVMALAGTEVVAGVLFLVPRTSTVGALGLLAVLAVAAGLHASFGWSPGGLLVWMLLVAVLALRRQEEARLATAGLLPPSALGDAQYVAAFEMGRIRPADFHHADHVRLAWLFLRRDPLPRALERFPEAIQRFARAAGKPQLYHATVTWTFLLAIHERMLRRPASDTWESFAAAHDELMHWQPSIVDSYYRQATLASDLARREFLLPDRLGTCPPTAGGPAEE